MTLRALVTGADGFVGGLLSRHLAESGWDVAGSTLIADPNAPERIVCDLRDPAQANRLVEQALPITHVFHLAAVTSVPESIKNPALAMRVNVEGTINMTAAVRALAPDARFLFVSSGEVYGPPQQLPVTENHPLAPVNPYAISKVAADHYCRYLHSANGFDVCCARPFNHTGPGQPDLFILPSLARQIALIEAKKAPPVLHVGNVEAKRDFLHVSDVIRAYEAIATSGKPGAVYNICSGRAWSIQEILHKLLALSTQPIDIRVDPARLRPVDVPEVWGSYDRLAADTGWCPQISLDELLRDLMTYWRGRES